MPATDTSPRLVPATDDPTTDQPRGGREFALDAWRSAATIRVVLFHLLGWGWLATVFPAMGVMFAIGGSLTARALAARPERNAAPVIYRRFRRVLPTVWVYGAVALLVSTLLGWVGGSAWEMLWWILPLHVAGPLGEGEVIVLTAGLWYIASYLWFVLLSPVLLGMLRNWPYVTLVVAILLPVVHYQDVLGFSGTFQEPAAAFAHYGICWIIGMAHREGVLARIHGGVLWPAVGLVAVLVAGTVLIDPLSPAVVDLIHTPIVHALWQAAFAAAVLRLIPPDRPSGPSRVPAIVSNAVRMASARALTIYVWHFACIMFAYCVVGPLATRPIGLLAVVGLTLACILVAMLAAGWVEDVAARRPPKLLGWRPAAPRVPVQRTPEHEPEPAKAGHP